MMAGISNFSTADDFLLSSFLQIVKKFELLIMRSSSPGSAPVRVGSMYTRDLNPALQNGLPSKLRLNG
eukprot:IDg13953t1